MTLRIGIAGLGTVGLGTVILRPGRLLPPAAVGLRLPGTVGLGRGMPALGAPPTAPMGEPPAAAAAWCICQ